MTATQLAPYITVGRVPSISREIWGYRCQRCSPAGGFTETYDTDLAKSDALIQAEGHALRRHRYGTPLLSPEQIDEICGTALSGDQVLALSLARQGRLEEDTRGFYVPDDMAQHAGRTVAKRRIRVLAARGLLQENTGRRGMDHRQVLLTEAGRHLLAMWTLARQAGLVEYADRDQEDGVTAAQQRSAYQLLAESRRLATTTRTRDS